MEAQCSIGTILLTKIIIMTKTELWRQLKPSSTTRIIFMRTRKDIWREKQKRRMKTN